ncbi:MAG: ScpA family protein [Actinomycetes bacterium]|jgi:segregation and condensation protein A|nr:MAG: segregation/condensation protein A [Actinomycetota bacterium]
MPFEVKTTVFEGPIDLLLQLITRRQVEITAVGLTEVVSDYLEFIAEMERLDMEITSEFLLIAATLIQLKSRSLLPRGGDFDLDEELALIEERDRLLARLLASMTFKDVAAVLLRRMQEMNRFVPRTSGVDQKIEPKPQTVEIPVDAPRLAEIAARVFARAQAEPDLDHLDLDLPSVADAIHDLRVRLEEVAYSTFDELTEHCTRKVEIAAYFLALLEMARWGLVELAQEDWLSEIEVRRGKMTDVPIESEWAS